MSIEEMTTSEDNYKEGCSEEVIVAWGKFQKVGGHGSHARLDMERASPLRIWCIVQQLESPDFKRWESENKGVTQGESSCLN